VPGARNAGAAAAEGQVLIFLDGHCYVPAGWLQPLLEALYVEPSVAMVGPTFADINPPHVAACGNTFRDESLERAWLPIREQATYVPFHGGGCHVVRSDAFHAAGGYDQGMTRWGSQDLELCLRLWLLGYSVVAQPASVIYHLFRKRHPYAVNGADVLYNKLRMAVVHFDAGRLQKVIRYLQQFQGADQILARVMTDATWSVRQQMLAARQRDVDWLFNRFQIPI
jgi:GT2 family glycosyltransferase